MQTRDHLASRTSASGPIPESTSAASPARWSPTSPAARRQGASTIAQQFVKNALAEQNNRTVFEKLREAALAYHLTHQWTKQKILTEYLNSIYFGNGAYGIESAARVYFGKEHGFDADAASDRAHASGLRRLERPAVHRPTCASVLSPGRRRCWPAWSPTRPRLTRSPTRRPPGRGATWCCRTCSRSTTSRARPVRRRASTSRCPRRPTSSSPRSRRAAPYFTSWLRPQILAAMGLGHGVPANVAEYRAYYGGLQIRTTIDLPMQQAAEQAIAAELPERPRAARRPRWSRSTTRPARSARWSGARWSTAARTTSQYPFNLATQGHRQPGSSFKPFTLAVALAARVTARTP